MPMFIDGGFPISVTSLDASVSVTTPYIQHASGDPALSVPVPAGADTLATLTANQTFSSKTLLAPVITGGNITSGALTQPVVTSGVFSAPTINTAVINTPSIVMTGGQLSGGIANNLILGQRTVVTLPVGATKTLDLATGDIFIVQLTQNCTLTIAAAVTGKCYKVVVKQNIANSYTSMSWMTGFINGLIASGPTQSTGAIDYWDVMFDGTYHYGIGVKNAT